MTITPTIKISNFYQKKLVFCSINNSREKLQLCIDVAVQNPVGLQIILIDGTENLTSENREKLYEKCREKGLQMIATRTTEDDELTVYEL